ncbi:MAG: Tn3 family transposase [Ktedonobacteraceae bacterium]
MPTRELLSSAQRTQFLGIPAEMSDQMLARYYTLSDDDQRLIKQRRRNHNRLGFAVQLAYLRFPGRTWAVNEEASPLVVSYIADQLKLNPMSIVHYGQDREATRYEHLAELEGVYGFRPFTRRAYREMAIWLLPLARKTDAGIALVSLLIEEMRVRKIIVPALSTIERLGWETRRRAQRQVYRQVTAGLTEVQRTQLKALLTVPAASRQTILVWLRQPPGAASPANFQKVIERLQWIRALELNSQAVADIHQNRLQQLAREGAHTTAQRLVRFDDDRRDATLVAFLLLTAEELVDTALDMHDKLMGLQMKKGERKQVEYLQKSRKAINEKVRLYARVGKALIAAKQETQDAYQAIESVLTWERFIGTVEEAEQLSTTTETDTAELLISRYGQFRRYTKELLSTFTFQGTTANTPVLQALQLLKELNETGKRSVPEDAPTDFVKGRWEKHVLQEEQVERHAYELCALSELRSGLRSGDIWIPGSRQYKAFEDYLMPHGQWEWIKQAGETEVELPADFATYISERKATLHRELTTVEQLLAEEKLPDVRLVKGELVITPLQKAVPEEVEALTRHAYDLLPRIKLPDLLLEVDAWTGFSRHFTHLQSGDQPKDRVALFATLLADAINLGLAKMADACADMTFNRLAWVVDWYVRDETHTKALAEVINYHHQHPFAAYWGDGTTSSSDGQRFKVGGRSEATSQVNLRYGIEPGVSFYTHISDQYGPYRVKVISSAVRDAPHMIDGLLYHETNLQIHEHYTDTWGYTDQVFGLCHLLGFRFAPRIAEQGKKRIYRIEKADSYPGLEPHLGGVINVKQIEAYWDDLHRLTSSIRKGTVTASLILGKLAAYPRQNGLAYALREVGRIEKSLFALDWLQSPELRRRVQVGLNKGEARNGLARAVCLNRLGEIHDRSYEDQRYRASALNLVVAAIILWNTVYLAEAIELLKQQGVTVNEELLQHLSPLGWEHINLTGDYLWNMKQTPASGQLRPLRLKTK